MYQVKFIADETMFSLVHTPSKIIAKRGKKIVQVQTSGKRTGNVTELIFKGQRLNAELTLNAPAETLFGVCSSSFIDDVLFEKWFTKLFLKHIPPAHPAPVILDGHSAHLTLLSTLNLARASLSTCTVYTHIPPTTQPLDKGRIQKQ